jgi:hypothetical protein
MADNQSAGGESVARDLIRQSLVTAATAIAAGVASLTFVALVGAAVMMARLRGAGLPTEAGVSVQPRSVLLAVGGEVLAPAIAAALASVFAVHFIPTSRTILPSNRADRIRRSIFAVVIALFGLVYYLAWSAGAFHFPFQTGIALVMVAFAATVGYVSGRLAATAVRARDERHALQKPRLGDPPAPQQARLASVELAYLGALAGAIMLFATIAAVTASLADPKIRPAAVLFTDGRGPLCGIYVAQNSDHLYIGEAVEDPHIRNVGVHRLGRMLDLPRSAVRALEIGSSQSLPAAHAAAPRILAELMAVHHVQPGQAQPVDCAVRP